MTLVESVEIPLGSPMPPFRLPDASGQVHCSWELAGAKGLLVVFTCNHCPYAKAQWRRLIELSAYAGELGVKTVAINANIHPDYPDDTPARMQDLVLELGLEFPYLVDGSQQTARQFKAQCTPDPYLFDSNRELVYHGRIDDNWQDVEQVTIQELKEAIDAMVAGEEVDRQQYPSMGCSIKWRQA